MRLVGLAVILAVSAMLAPLVAEAQEYKAGEVYRIGYLGNFAPNARNVEGFRQGLRRLSHL